MLLSVFLATACCKCPFVFAAIVEEILLNRDLITSVNYNALLSLFTCRNECSLANSTDGWLLFLAMFLVPFEMVALVASQLATESESPTVLVAA